MPTSPDDRVAALNELNTLAVEDFTDMWRRASSADLSSPEFRELITDSVPAIVDPYAAVAGDYGVQWYDESAPDLDYQAVSAPMPDPERLAGSSSWALNAAGGEALGRFAGIIQKAIFDTERDTITTNVERETGARWVRHARANACAFCRMLATRSDVYLSEASATTVVGRGVEMSASDRRARARGEGRGDRGRFLAGGRTTRGSRELGEKYHDYCRCTSLEIRPGQTYLPPPYVEKWEQQYIDAVRETDEGGAINLKAVLAHMRQSETSERAAVAAGKSAAAKKADDLAAWLGAEKKYGDDVVSWLGAEAAYNEQVTSWLEAESKYSDDVAAWLAAEKKAIAAAKRAARTSKNSILSPSSRKLIEDAKATLPTDRAGWLDTTLKYPRDVNGAKLVPEKLQRHLDTTLTVGKSIRDDAMKRIDKDAAVKKLRAEDKQLVATTPFSPRRQELKREIARREQAIIRETLAEVRPIGGAKQTTELSTLDIGDADPGTAEGIAAVRRAETIFPDDWLQAATARGPLRVGETDRAFYNGDFDFIAAPSKDYLPNYRGAFDSYPDEIMAHELGHRMERTIPGLTQLEFALVRSRSTKNGVLEPMTPVYSNRPDLAGEIGFEDDWRQRYAGKSYANDSMADPASRAMEAFQVGLQDTFGRSHPDGEFDKTSQLQEFVIGVMALL